MRILMSLMCTFLLGLITINVVHADDWYEYQMYQDFARTASPEKVKQGQVIYQQNCARCHGPDGMRSPRRDVMPIAYMHPGKVFEELMDYRTDDDFFDWEEQAMIDVTRKLSFENLEAVALYVGTLRGNR